MDILVFLLVIACIAGVGYIVFCHLRALYERWRVYEVSPIGLHLWLTLFGLGIFLFGTFTKSGQPLNAIVGVVVGGGCIGTAVYLNFVATRDAYFAISYSITLLVLVLIILAILAAIKDGKRARRNSQIHADEEIRQSVRRFNRGRKW